MGISRRRQPSRRSGGAGQTPAALLGLSPADAAALTQSLLNWYAAVKRDLPWRRASHDPYAVWVSEVMLQQTTVKAVVGHYQRFVAAFPTVADLALAEEPAVLRAWAGLGYYRRARNLHAAARAVMRDHNGCLPNTAQSLATLPGVGRYTAAAVASIAYGQPVAVVDTNVARVMARLFCVEGDPRQAGVASRLWELAQSLIPAEAPGAFNSAMMELGATVCRAASPPDCPACPLRKHCRAAATGRPQAWPHMAPRPPARAVTEVAVVIVPCHPCRQAPHVLVAQRRPDDLWAGLWECPRGRVRPRESPDRAAVRVAAQTTGLTVELAGRRPTLRHTVTTRAITLHVRLTRLRPLGANPDQHDSPTPPRPDTSTRDAVVDYAALRWVTLAQAGDLPHSSPQARILKSLSHETIIPS